MRNVLYKQQILLVFPGGCFWTNFDGNTFHWKDIEDFEKSAEASFLGDSWFS